MSRSSGVLLMLGVLACQGANAATSADVLLRKIVQAYQVKPLTADAQPLGAKERLGQALFFDPVVSGPKTIACAACHVRSLGSGDKLPMAVGLGAGGVGVERLKSPSAFVVPRNTLALFDRGSSEFTAMFWDGRVQRSPGGTFESPLGAQLPAGFDSLLAVASVFPPAEPDEMLGRAEKLGGPQTYHGELLAAEVDADNYQARTIYAQRNLIRRLLAPGDAAPDAMVSGYRGLFAAAYPGVPIERIGIQHFGNALAAYISAAFALKPARWDLYVAGDLSALNDKEKKGAIVFFGKGRCAVCHSGVEFSDFSFHSLAIPQLRLGKSRNVDYGRGAATGRGQDRFAFRTPPLRNVVDTPPYAHNGSIPTLEEIIEHHFNPVPRLYAAQQLSQEEAGYAGKLLGYRSSILAEIAPLSGDDLNVLTSFLGALSSPTVMPDAVAVPAAVPSGLSEFARQ